MEFCAENFLNSMSGKVPIGGLANILIESVGGPHEFGGWLEVCFWEKGYQGPLGLLSHYRVSREKAVVHGGGKLARELVRSTQ